MLGVDGQGIMLNEQNTLTFVYIMWLRHSRLRPTALDLSLSTTAKLETMSENKVILRRKPLC